jgi:hypothetical protein
MCIGFVFMQEQQRALKAVQQQAKISGAKLTATVTVVNSKEKQPRKDTGDDVRFYLFTLSFICLLYLLG